MKQILAIACLLLGLAATAQKTDMQQLNDQIKKSAAEVKQQMAQTDSLRKSIDNMLKQQLDSQRKSQIARDAQRSGDMMLQWHNERQAKQKRKMFLYFGLGIFFLGVLVVGLMRKGKQKKAV
jgi:septal ring factor EnvC (AmiA/AmiB activator)